MALGFRLPDGGYEQPSTSHISILEPVARPKITIESKYLEIINETIRRRKLNRRDDITQALKAGRALTELKPTIPHGKWQEFVLANTDYTSVREYQIDMRFWEYWKPYVDRLQASGIIFDLNSPENDLVGSLTDEEIQVCFSALHEFTSSNVPEFAIEAALKSIESGNGLTIADSKRIAAAAKKVENLESETVRDIARDMIVNSGVTNPDVLELLPTVIAEAPEIIQEIRDSGHIFVPGVNNGDGRQVKIANASRTDLEIVLGRHSIEEELSRQKEIKDDLFEVNGFDYLGTIEGSPSDIINQIMRYLNDPGKTYKVSISCKPRLIRQ